MPSRRTTRDEAAEQVAQHFPGANVRPATPAEMAAHHADPHPRRPARTLPQSAPDEVRDDYDPDDPYDLPDLAAGIIVPEGRAGGEDLVDRLLCFRPLRMVEVSTEYGPKPGTEAYVVEVGGENDPPYLDHGKLPFLWQYVRAELNKATPEAPWVVGRVVKRKTAYFLNPPTPQERKAAGSALRAFLEDRAAERGQ